MTTNIASEIVCVFFPELQRFFMSVHAAFSGRSSENFSAATQPSLWRQGCSRSKGNDTSFFWCHKKLVYCCIAGFQSSRRAGTDPKQAGGQPAKTFAR
ncbi:MAG: hypothetical protein HC848_09180 [Limnobacter sp.]|nr:hypothetical protein [Limnobacter sp.]